MESLPGHCSAPGEVLMKSPFKAKSSRRRRMEARRRAELLDRYGEQIRLVAIGGGIVLVAVMVIKLVIR